jgi:hypothetical protein
MKIERVWAMPNKWSFEIKPIKLYLDTVLPKFDTIIEPFTGMHGRGTITNDLNPEFDTMYHMDAIDFLKTFDDKSADCVLFDPPYTLRQVKECYNMVGINSIGDNSKYFYSSLKDEISRIIKPNGCVISFGYSSNGIGKSRGFEIDYVMLIAHGGNHNDTIMTVEHKIG